MNNNRLTNDNPLIISPVLAVIVGLNESIVLQQVHYWVSKNGKMRDGHLWTYNTIRDWHKQFPFWCRNTVQNTFNNLRDQGLLITGRYNKMNIDKTLWYRIDYKALQDKVNSSITQKLVNGDTKNWVKHLPKFGKAIPDINLILSLDNFAIAKEPNDSTLKKKTYVKPSRNNNHSGEWSYYDSNGEFQEYD